MGNKFITDLLGYEAPVPVSLISVCLQVAGLSLIGPLHLLECNNTGMWCFPMHSVYAAMKTRHSDGEINHWMRQW